MKKNSQLMCSCAHCDYIIHYSPEAVGHIAECPNCKEKSLLPPAVETPSPGPVPPAVETPRPGPSMKPRQPAPKSKPVRWVVIGGIGLLVVGAIVLLPQLRHRRPAVATTAPSDVQSPPALLPQPKVKRSKSLNDLKIGSFDLQPKKDSDVRIVAGDIVNDSESLHRGIKVELEVRDARGLKVDSLDAFITELAPHATWHVLSSTSNPRAASVTVTALQEKP
jgi:hypothetical protein